MSMGATKVTKEDPSVVEEDSKAEHISYALGQPIQKVFGMHQGRYEGVVTVLPTPSVPYYRVFYPADEDEEDIAVEDMPKYAVSNVGGLRYPNNSSRGLRPRPGLR